jgi:hypothetical protein
MRCGLRSEADIAVDLAPTIIAHRPWRHQPARAWHSHLLNFCRADSNRRDLARKLAALSKEIDKLSKKVGDAAPPAPQTPERQAQQMKDLAEETGKKLTAQLDQNPEEFAKMTAGMAKGLEEMKDFFEKNPMPTPPPAQTPPPAKPPAPAKAAPAKR